MVEPGGPIERDAKNHHRAVVYLETAPRGAFEERESRRASHGPAQRDVRAARARDHVGHDGRLPEHDRTYHNVFSLSQGEARSTSGATPPGKSKSVRFDRPGIVRVFCDIHSHMSAFILVFAHRFFAVTDDEGRYRIDEVPPGTYTVVGWYEGTARESARA